MHNTSQKNIHFRRVYIVIVGILIFWAALEIRLFSIQVRDHDFYNELSKTQSAKKIELAARRGNIYDRNQECMATDLIHYDMGVDLNKVKNKRQVAEAFAKNLRRPASYFLRRMDGSRQFVYLARKISREQMQAITSLQDPGIVSIEGYRRRYPFGKCASQLIGFTDVDNKGISGVELQFEDILSGKNGWTFLLADARRRFGYNVDYPHVPSQPGVDIKLTIDKNFQTIVENELDQAVNQYRGNYGIAVLLNPNTGEILAMYSSPGFNPNSPETSSIDQRRNRAIADIFEPGSTFKIFPAAALLQENIKKPNDIVFCENGKYKFYNHTVNDSKKYGWLSFQRVIENSSNIGMVKLSADISRNTFYQYIKNFGFDSQTGVNLIGESTGLLAKPKDFSGLSKGVISFGQEIGVTALQITNAYAAVINGGNLMRPYLVDEVRNLEGVVVEKNTAQKIRQVISSEVAYTLKQFMLGSVEHGTGKKAQIPGIAVGGKTGTAQKYNKKTRRYLHGEYLASFIGFAPAEHPQYVLAIFIDSPNPLYYGGDVAAPVFAKIMRRILNFGPSDSEYDSAENAPQFAETSTGMPNFSGLSLTALEDYCELKDLEYKINGKGKYIVSQANTSDQIEFRLGQMHIESNRMPDLTGLTIREALRNVDFSKFRVQIKGSGRVKNQSVNPGKAVKERTVLILTCGN